MIRLSIDPITRIEGHMKVELEVEEGVVRSAWSSGALYRGLERILVGRHPLDAQKITQRICGVCPLAHSTAASMCLDDALAITDEVPANGLLLRNLIYGANFLHNHVLHFYQLALPDYLDPSVLGSAEAVPLAQLLAPGGRPEDRRFTDEENRRLVGHYVQALQVRRKAQELVALLGGKMPHDMAIVPGGVTFQPGMGELEAFRFRLAEVKNFIENCYLPDVLLWADRYRDHFELGRTGDLLTFGAFPDENGRLLPAGSVIDGVLREVPWSEVTEVVDASWYAEDGETPAWGKARAYTWIKAPRLAGRACEVGPAARARVALEGAGNSFRDVVHEGLQRTGVMEGALASVAGRHLCRALEARFIASTMEVWLDRVALGQPVARPFELPQEGEGRGLTDAPRGALGHWLKIRAGRIAHYQVISPTTWNASPRDANGKPGPIEAALVGTRVVGDGRTEAGRVVRSFDPCLACAVQ